MIEMDPTKRFSSRVKKYVRFRPRYPQEIIDCLEKNCGLTSASVVADIGSGTGISSEPFLQNGNRVYGVEPNDEMRAAAEDLLAAYDNFASHNGSAEATGLADESIEFVVAGQAFHWFNMEAARAEFARILRPNGMAVLVWNSRNTDAKSFMAAYEKLLGELANDYALVNEHKASDDETIARFYAPHEFQKVAIDNDHLYDLETLRGRALSSSYSPLPEQPNYQPFLERLDAIFNKHQQNGQVCFGYTTRLYWGQLK